MPSSDRHTLTVTESNFQLTLLSGAKGDTGAAGADGAAGAAGPNSVTSATTSDGACVLNVSRLTADSITTTSTTVSTMAYLAMSGNQEFADNAKAQFGGSQDLEIYHDGTGSVISESGAGGLTIQGNSTLTLAKTDGEFMATFDPDGAVNLYYDNALKLATTATGVALTNADLTLGDATTGVNGKIKLGTGGDLEIFHNGLDSYIDDVGTGNLNIRGSASVNLQKYSGETFIACQQDNSVTIYYDNVVKLATSATGVSVSGTLTAIDVKASGDLGYSSGGTATQATSITTGAILNAPSGVITCQSHAFGQDDSQTFTLTNSHIDANDVILVSFQTGHPEINVTVSDVSAASCNITLHRSHSGGSLTLAPVLNFAIIKVATNS